MAIATRSKNTQASTVAKKSAATASGKGKGKGKRNTLAVSIFFVFGIRLVSSSRSHCSHRCSIFVENVNTKNQSSRSNGVKVRKKKKDTDAGTSAKEKAVEEKKSSRISNAIMKKIDGWWEQNSDALVKFALDEWYWEDDHAKGTVIAYKQFLILKREVKDWENELLPCDSVVEMIQQHQKHTSLDFTNDLKLLCGRDFEGRDIVIDRKENNINRQRMTLEAMKQRFGAEFNEEIWGMCAFDLFEVNEKDENNFCSTTISQGAIADPLEMFLGDLSYHFYEYEDIQFILEHKQEVIDPKTDTILSLDLTSFDTVLAAPKHCFWLKVEMKVKGSDTSNKSFVYIADKKLAIVKDSLKAVVKKNDDSEYIYFFNGKRLYGFETPLSLQMRHFDIIEAVPAEDFKYPKCICCNNTECEVEG